MMDKFAAYYCSKERISELSDYVHLNFQLIQVKMVSELRRKLDITPDLGNSDGYASLTVSLYGRMFNELIYGLAGLCQTFKLNLSEIVPLSSLETLLMLLKNQNPLEGKIRSDFSHISEEERNRYYLENIEEIRAVIEALPK